MDSDVVASLRQRRKEIDRAMQKLDAERDAIDGLLDIWDARSSGGARLGKLGVSGTGTVGARTDDDDAPDPIPPGLDPGDAIDLFVDQNPGHKNPEIADALEDKIKSNAKNRRSVIFTNIHRRLKDGRFWADENGRVYAADHPRAQAAREQLDLGE